MADETTETTETIIIRWMVDNADAIKRHQELRGVVLTIREQLKELSAQSGATYKEMSKAMVAAFSSGEIKKIMEQNPLMKMKEAMEQAAPAIEQYKQAMATALAIIRSEVQNTGTMWSTSSRNVAQQQKAEAQAVKDAQKQEQDASRLTTQAKLKDIEQQTAAMKYLEQEAKKAAQASAQASGGGKGGGLLGGLFGGGGIKGLIGSLVGITSAVTLVRQLINFLNQATESAYEFQKSLFGMVVGVRALQRAGVDITIKEMTNQLLSLKEEFGVFSMKDLVEGSAAFLNLNRDMGFTKQQLFDLQRAIATLAVVNGRSMDEVQRTVALALSSGYTEGLQRLGVSINRVTIAAEASAMGWKGGYTSLTEVQRAAATYNLIIRKTAIYQEDLLRYQETLPGKIDTTTKSIEDQTVAWGNNTLAIKLWIKQLEDYALKVLNLSAAQVRFMAGGEETKKAMEDYAEQYVKDYEKQIGKALDTTMRWEQDRFSERTEKLVEGRNEFVKKMTEGMQIDEILASIGLGDVSSIISESDKLQQVADQAVSDNLMDILDAQKEFEEESIKEWDEYQQDLLEISQEHWAAEKELFDEWATDYLAAQNEHMERDIGIRDEHFANMDEIEDKWASSRGDAEKGYQKDVSDTWVDYYRRIEDAQRKFANNMEDAEAAFQERMRKLREGFLFDLEDAIRARDARQVLQLIRRYSLESGQAQREYEQQKEKMKRDHQQQLAELARQRDERLAQLYEELQARLLAIDAERKEEQEREAKRWQKEQDDEKKRWEDKQIQLRDRYKEQSDKEDDDYAKTMKKREDQYNKDLTALENHFKDRMRVIAENIVKEVGTTQDALNAMVGAMVEAIGPGSTVELVWGYMVQYIQRASAQAATAMSYIMAFQQLVQTWFPTMYPELPGPNLPNQAEGGIHVANRPTRVTFGEAGPELAAFIPLRSNASPNVLTSMGGGNGGGGRVQVEITLDEYLEGRIVDTALDNVADVIIRRYR